MSMVILTKTQTKQIVSIKKENSMTFTSHGF